MDIHTDETVTGDDSRHVNYELVMRLNNGYRPSIEEQEAVERLMQEARVGHMPEQFKP